MAIREAHLTTPYTVGVVLHYNQPLTNDKIL